MEHINHVVNLHHSLWCRDSAVELCANDLLSFHLEDQTIKILVWCGRAFQSDMVEDYDCWEEATWDDVPILIELLNKYGESGIFAWCAKKRRADRYILTKEVGEIYSAVSAHINHYRFSKSWNVTLRRN